LVADIAIRILKKDSAQWAGISHRGPLTSYAPPMRRSKATTNPTPGMWLQTAMPGSSIDLITDEPKAPSMWRLPRLTVGCILLEEAERPA
jgi:hypothetical protein